MKKAEGSFGIRAVQPAVMHSAAGCASPAGRSESTGIPAAADG